MRYQALPSSFVLRTMRYFYFLWYNTTLLNYLELHPDVLKAFCNDPNDCPAVSIENSAAFPLHDVVRDSIVSIENFTKEGFHGR